MKVAVYYSNIDIRIEERPKPRISSGEILVKMKASGICGTDVMEWYRMKKAPRILGHEMAGEIAAIGRGVKGLKKGDRVFVSHHVPCYRCHLCSQGNYTACGSLHTGNYDPGGFSEFIRIPKENVKYGTFLLPAEITYEDASMIEPLGCVIAGQKQLGLKKGQTVLIIGSGVSGILHIQLARLNELKSINDGRIADVVIICASAQQAVDNAISSVERKGKILFFAVPETDIRIPSLRFWRNEISVTFSYGASPDDLKEAIRLIASKKIVAGKMITHRVKLSDIRKGFQIASESKESLKVVVVPDNDI
jgi:L-iditol 2-dehydrogenase